MCLIELWNLADISNQIMTALILHNVVVSDHVMGDVNRQYNPVESTEDFGDFGILPQLNATIQNEADNKSPCTTIFITKCLGW